MPIDFVTTHEYPVAEYCAYPDREGSPYETGRYFRGRFEYAYNLVKSSRMPNLEYKFSLISAKDGTLTVPFSLEPNEVMYVEIQKKAPQAYFESESDGELAQLNEMLMTDDKYKNAK